MLSSQQPLQVPKHASMEERLGQRAFLLNLGKEEIKEGAELLSAYLGSSVRVFLTAVLLSSFYALPYLPRVCCVRKDQELQLC